MLSRIACVCSHFLLVPLIAFGQYSSVGADLGGTVIDPAGESIPECRITLTNELNGVSLVQTTGIDGGYRFLALPPATYSLLFEMDGFQSKRMVGVRVTVGQAANLDVELALGVQSEAIEVTGVPALVESRRASQSNTMEQEWIENLPINRRDYLTFTLLAPGVSDANGLSDNTDFRAKQTPQSGLSFYGSNGRGNSITVDGGEANEGSGGVRSTLSQEAVQEFQINRSNYSAELGGASGGVINIVSKTGSNDWHGSLFAFFRDDSLDAGDPFARVFEDGQLVRIKPPSQRQQFGGSVGGPIKKNKTFLFGAFEGTMRDESSVSSLLNDPSIFKPTEDQEQFLELLPPPVADQLRQALTASPDTVELFAKNAGIFPYKTRGWIGSIRLDHYATDNDRLFFRFAYADLEETNANVQALVGASRGSEVDQFDPTAILGWSHAFSSRALNEMHVQFNYRDFKVESIDKLGPELRITGFAVLNRDLFLPSRAIERRLEIRDTFSYNRGAHTLKVGGRVLVRGTYSENNTFIPGGFTFGSLPGNLLNPALPPEFIVNGIQAFNLGLAQTYTQGFGDPVVASTNPYYSAFVQDSWRVRPNLSLDIGLRYELDTRNPPLRTDTNNFAPRVGFSWDPFGDGKTAVRGGYGIFYSPIYYQIDWVVKALNDVNGSRQLPMTATTILTPGNSAAHIVYSTLKAQGVLGSRSIQEQDLLQFGITFPNTGPLPPLAVIFEGSEDYANPYAQQASFTVERELFRDTTLTLGYTWVRTLKIPRSRDSNLLPAAVDPNLGIRVWSDPLRDFVNPFMAARNVYESTANAYYNGLLVEFRKRFGNGLAINANYTFSKAIDDVTDFTADFIATDQTNLRAERAISAFDQRHKFVVAALWDAPWGLQIAPVVRGNTGRPFNLLVGSDLNQDRHANSDRPPGAGRNTGLGPSFWTFDIRVGRRFKLGSERVTLDLTAEAFNTLNRLNFASINNTVGLMPGPFNVSGRHDRSPSESLGFASAQDARRIQLGLRIQF